ncbi:MAG: diguanylate cyclase [Desulfurispora sp.]|uniref:diguanylate cyclase n=1 Tax=Desulfurispora sp. TaxID=3014275 RepID=UPI00404A2AE2
MSLKTKLLLTLSGIFAFSTLLIWLLSRLFTAGVLADMEKNFYYHTAGQVADLLQRELALLESSAGGWATKNELYAFTRRQGREPLREAFVAHMLEKSRLNYLVVLDSQGRVLLSRSYDRVSNNTLPLPPGLTSPPRAARSGLVSTLAGPALMTVRPITGPDHTGSPAGTLLIGRLLRPEEIKELETSTGVRLSFAGPGEVNLSSLERARPLADGTPCYYRVVSRQESILYLPLTDWQGRTAYLLRIQLPRRVASVFYQAEKYFAAGNLLAALLTFALTMFWLNHTCLSRLKRLTDALHQGGSTDLPTDIPLLSGHDELARLSRAMHQLLEKLALHRQDKERQELKHRAILDNMAEGIVVVQDGNIKYLNQAGAHLLGCPPEQATGRDFLSLVHPEDQAAMQGYCLALTDKGGVPVTQSFRSHTGDGREKWLEANSTVINWEKGPAHLHFISDITPRKILEEELSRLMAEKNLILDSLTEMVTFIDRDLHIIWANRAAAQAVGKNVLELMGAKCHAVRFNREEPCTGCPMQRTMDSGQPYTGELETPDGRWLRINASPVFDRQGQVTGAVEAVLDITERRLYEEQLRYLSMHDVLTGLYNRAFFQAEMARLEKSRAYPITVLLADLDGLKLVNDTLGHDQGDELIKACAGQLKAALRSSDILARIGGDEFAALLPDTDEQAAQVIVERLHRHLEAYNSKSPALPVLVSIGRATSPTPDKPLSDTLKEADAAMYAQKIQQRDLTRPLLCQAITKARPNCHQLNA